mmetsp:Transcript_23894/g.67687  ORF Transcript_23894/g.67687 Transcript_23894/m.67687 type:complete len:288 (+) Transcript_23894:29-892(+)
MAAEQKPCHADAPEVAAWASDGVQSSTASQLPRDGSSRGGGGGRASDKSRTQQGGGGRADLDGDWRVGLPPREISKEHRSTTQDVSEWRSSGIPGDWAQENALRGAIWQSGSHQWAASRWENGKEGSWQDSSGGWQSSSWKANGWAEENSSTQIASSSSGSGRGRQDHRGKRDSFVATAATSREDCGGDARNGATVAVIAAAAAVSSGKGRGRRGGGCGGGGKGQSDGQQHQQQRQQRQQQRHCARHRRRQSRQRPPPRRIQPPGPVSSSAAAGIPSASPPAMAPPG